MKVWGERFAVTPDSILRAKTSVNARFLWTILARYAGPGGECYPGLRTLAEIMGVSEDTVRRVKKGGASEAGLLECHARFDTEGRQTSDNLVLRTPPSTGARGEGGTGATLSSTSSELNKSFTPQAQKRPSPTFECPVCLPGVEDLLCPVCNGAGKFRMEDIG